jgi:hypothetical protein
MFDLWRRLSHPRLPAPAPCETLADGGKPLQTGAASVKPASVKPASVKPASVKPASVRPASAPRRSGSPRPRRPGP